MVVTVLAIAKGNVISTERGSHLGNTEPKKSQGQSWQCPFSTVGGEKVLWPMNIAN